MSSKKFELTPEFINIFPSYYSSNWPFNYTLLENSFIVGKALEEIILAFPEFDGRDTRITIHHSVILEDDKQILVNINNHAYIMINWLSETNKRNYVVVSPFDLEYMKEVLVFYHRKLDFSI